MKKRIIPILLLSTMIFSFVSCGNNNESSSTQSTSSYSFNVKNKEDKIIKGVQNTQYAGIQIPVTYFNDSKIPYLSLTNLTTFMNKIYYTEGSNYLSYTLEKAGNKTFKLTNSYYNETATIDYNNKTISFSDIYLFQNQSLSEKGTNITIYNNVATNKKDPLLRIDNASYNKGSATTIDLNSYASISLPYYEDEGYIPFSTAFDVLFNKLNVKFSIVNDQIFVINSQYEVKYGSYMTQYGEMYYNAGKNEELTSEQLNYNYDETCLLFDYFYGLKDILNISSFDSFFTQQKLKERMLKSSKEYDKAFKAFTTHYINDFHTTFDLPSAFSSSDEPVIEESSNYQNYLDQYYAMLGLRYTVMNNEKQDNYSVPAYEVVDDTAIITLDKFTVLQNVDKEYSNEDRQYTFRLIANALNDINSNTSIKNVVLDLSCNIGGTIDAGIDVVNVFLGHCDFSMKNLTNGSTMTTRYSVDSSLDGVIDDNDHLRDGVNKYVIDSSISFSCGNYVPCALKEGGVTLLGRRTRGGTCTVASGISSIGTYFKYSSSYQLSLCKDGNYSHINNGVTPDYEITDYSSIFDRSKLVTKIHDIQSSK